MRADPCGTHRALLGESPVWDESRSRLLWVDLDGARVHAWDATAGDATLFACDEPVGAVCLRATGGAVVAAGTSIVAFDDAGGSGGQEVQPIADLRLDGPHMRLNDARCDAQGRLWAGSCSREPAAAPGALYCLDPSGAQRVARADVAHPNGLDWSPDGETLFFVDSRSRIVWRHAFDPADGTLGPPEEVRRFDPEDGMPDGLSIDADGRLWLAFWGGGVVRCLSPDGTVEEVVTVDTPLVTSCAFGGAELEQLFVTTAQGDPADGGAAGMLHVVEPGVRGRLPGAFAG